MSESAGNPSTRPAKAGGDFYVTGGTLRPDAQCYVERQADRDLCEGLLRGEFCYVLTSRQMGKSSLMVRTVKRLRQEGAAVAVLDLTAIGQNLTIEQWYDGLMSRLGQQLDLEDELLEFWHGHPEWGPLQRWLSAIEQVVLRRYSNRVIIFVDEIDIVRSLPFSTDEFFAAIRESYNRRSREPGFARLAFGLLGVATPTDLIRDTRMTPFNIGRRIELNDFTAQEAAPLAWGLGPAEKIAQDLLERVLYWTGGHPYLTQRLCQALAETLNQPPLIEAASTLPAPPVIPTARTVDLLAEKLFLTRQARDRDDNLIFVRERILRSDSDVAGLLYLYRKIHTWQSVADDETNPLVSVLRLSGITRGVDGYLQVRNRIYSHVFDHGWINASMPHAEIRRQRTAGRRGLFLGLSIAIAIVLIYIFVVPRVKQYGQSRQARRTPQVLESAYRHLSSYQDNFETTAEIGLGGTIVPVTGSGSILFERTNKAHLILKSTLTSPPMEVRLLSDGQTSLAYAPSLNQYCRRAQADAPFDLPESLARQVGPMRILPLYRLLLQGPAADSFVKNVQNTQFAGYGDIEGEPVIIVNWEHVAGPLLESLGLTNPPSDLARIPVTAWVGVTNHLMMQVRMDLSHWAEELVGHSPEIPVTGLIITESHKISRISETPIASTQFDFEPPLAAKQVTRFELAAPDLLLLATPKRQFSRLIPARLPQTPSNLIDLTEYYNACFLQAWHVLGDQNNTLMDLPTGLLQFGGVTFDVRGIVQLTGRELQKAGGQYPLKIDGIQVEQTCRQLHFLQATGWRAPEGTRIGTYVVHYGDGQEREIPIVYGEDVRDWNAKLDPATHVKRSSLVWRTINKAELPVRLFKSTWTNPLPDTQIVTIDYLSTRSEAAPFLIAITAEP